MKISFKMALLVAMAVLIPSATAVAATVFTLTTPSSVNVVLAPGMTMYSYSGTFSSGSCTTTSVSSLPYGNVAQGASQTLYECIENTGGTSFYLTSSSFSTDLSSSVGTISTTYYLTGSSTPSSLPIFMTSSDEVVVAFDLTVASGATVASTNFNIILEAFSTSSG